MKMEMVMMKIKIVTKMKADQFFLQGARVGLRLQLPTFLQDCEQKPPRYGEICQLNGFTQPKPHLTGTGYQIKLKIQNILYSH